MDKMVTPIFQTSNDGVEFLIISTKFLLDLTKFLAKESDGSAVLTQHTTNTGTQRITINLESLLDIR